MARQTLNAAVRVDVWIFGQLSEYQDAWECDSPHCFAETGGLTSAIKVL